MTAARLGVWPPLPFGAYVRRRADPLPFPLGDPRCRLYALGRHALWHGLRALGLEEGDEVLAPAYHHGSEIEAIVAAGLSCRFYEATLDLEPDEDELERLAGPRTRALHLIHPLGFTRDLVRWRRWCDERGLLLLEDAAQAWLSSRDGHPAGSLGDASIFCLYKSVGVADGGALICRKPPPPPGGRRVLGVAGLARRHRAWMAQHRPELVPQRAAAPASIEYDPAADFALGDPGRPAAAATRYLASRLAGDRVATSRRESYRTMLGALAPLVPPPFGELPEGASPMALPLAAAEKARLLAALHRAGVKALDFWSTPHPSLAAELFEGAAARRAATVALPVHQELTGEHLERMAAVVRELDPEPSPLVARPARG
jgi:dTDP-4-amino-4,6-dideoxygalactose transaminase